MTIIQMEAFVETAKTGNMSKAGENLFVSQQNISKNIRTLEQELGFPVFQRNNNGVQLTNSGRILYDSWKNIIIEYHSAIDKARDNYYGEQQIIRIGIIDLGGRLQEVTDALLNYNELFSDLTLEFQVLQASRALEQLNRGDIHICISYGSELESYEDIKNLKLNTKQIPIGIFLSRKDPLAGKKTILPADLQNRTIGVLKKDVSMDYVDRIQRLVKEIRMDKSVEIREYSSRTNLELALVSQKCISIAYESMFGHLEHKLRFYPLSSLIKENSDITVNWKDPKYEIKARNIAEFLRSGNIADTIK